MKPKEALPDPHTVALQALAWLASDEERLVRFLNLSGLTPGGLRRTATEPASLGAVLDSTHDCATTLCDAWLCGGKRSHARHIAAPPLDEM